MKERISPPVINDYLIRIKSAISEGRYKFVGREKNLKSITEAGLLIRHVKDVIFKLTYRNYFNGPEQEKDNRFPPGEYLFFGKEIEGIDFFIKLKLENVLNEDFCICISSYNRFCNTQSTNL